MIVTKAGMSFKQILSDLKQRLSLYNVFCVYDEVDHNRAYVYANLSMQNQKIDLLFQNIYSQNRGRGVSMKSIKSNKSK